MWNYYKHNDNIDCDIWTKEVIINRENLNNNIDNEIKEDNNETKEVDNISNNYV